MSSLNLFSILMAAGFHVGANTSIKNMHFLQHQELFAPKYDRLKHLKIYIFLKVTVILSHDQLLQGLPFGTISELFSVRSWLVPILTVPPSSLSYLPISLHGPIETLPTKSLSHSALYLIHNESHTCSLTPSMFTQNGKYSLNVCC